jgi:hypothetical protein
LSLQESIIPVVQVTRPKGVADAPTAVIKDVKWTGLRCRVIVDAASSRIKRQDGASTFNVDLRQKANDPKTTMAGGGKTLKVGKASLVVEDDDLEGEAISLVVLDAQGQAIARVATVIGGEE